MPIKPNAHIPSIDPYQPGKSMEELESERGITGAIKLASNENPLGPSKKVLAVLRKGVQSVHRYPEGSGRRLRETIATRFKIDPHQILLGNGSDEVMELACKVYLVPGDEAIVADRTFSIYSILARSQGGKILTVPLLGGRYDLEAMLRCISARTRLIFICNPNNPTGTMVDQHAMRAFLDRIPERILVIVDEAYGEYATHPDFPNSILLAKSGAPILVLRTFSKFYGLAGLRVGYGIAHPQVIQDLNRIRLPFNTNVLAQQAAMAALGDESHARRSRSINETGRSYLTRAFGKLGLEQLPSQANFIYVNLGRPGRAIYHSLLDEGIIVRPIEGNWIRVGIGLPRENKRFIGALAKILGSRYTG